MTVERTISKRLAGDEDFALGEGTETQSRNGQNVTITQVRRIQPVNSIEELNSLDTSRYVKACRIDTSTGTFHMYAYENGEWKLLRDSTSSTSSTGSSSLELVELVELVELEDGQVEVTFTNPIDLAAFYLTGPSVSNTRLFVGLDYSANHTTRTITLFNSCPAGTTLVNTFYETNEVISD